MTDNPQSLALLPVQPICYLNSDTWGIIKKYLDNESFEYLSALNTYFRRTIRSILKRELKLTIKQRSLMMINVAPSMESTINKNCKTMSRINLSKRRIENLKKPFMLFRSRWSREKLNKYQEKMLKQM